MHVIQIKCSSLWVFSCTVSRYIGYSRYKAQEVFQVWPYYLLRLNPLQKIHISVYCQGNRGVIWGVVSRCWFKCLKGTWSWQGEVLLSTLGPLTLLTHHCASHNSCRRECQKVGWSLRKYRWNYLGVICSYWNFRNREVRGCVVSKEAAERDAKWRKWWVEEMIWATSDLWVSLPRAWMQVITILAGIRTCEHRVMFPVPMGAELCFV